MADNKIQILKDFFVSSDTVFNVLTSITVFFLGFLFKELINTWIRFRNRKFIRQLIKFNLIGIINGLEMEVIALTEFQATLIINNQNRTYQHKGLSGLNALISLGYNNLFKAYFSGIENFFFKNDEIRIKGFSDFWATIYFLNSFHPRLVPEVLSVNEKLNGLLLKRNESFQNAYDLLEDFLVNSSGISLPEDFGKFCISIHDTVLRWKQNSTVIDITLTNQLFIDLNQIIASNLEVCLKYRDRFDMVIFSSLFNKAINDYANLAVTVDSAAQTYLANIKNYKTHIEKLKFFGKHLTKLKLNSTS